MKLLSRPLDNLLLKRLALVKFEHKSYDQMTTAPEYWVEYELFDAQKDGAVKDILFSEDFEYRLKDSYIRPYWR